jgi:hypothetical protein
MSTVAPFVVIADLTAVAIAYRNTSLIADEVMPRVPISNQKYRYRVWEKEERYTIPNTRVGRLGVPNRVTAGFTEESGFAEGYALDDPVPNSDINQNVEGYDPLAHAAEYITDLLELDREVRVATLMFDAAQYVTGNKVTLSGTDQWSDQANSDPIGDIETALTTPLVRPNTLVFGQQSWSTLRKHPDILNAVIKTGADKGLARRSEVAELFEVDNVYVGRGHHNTAKKGQTATFSRVWGDSMAAIHLNPTAGVQRGLTFCFSPTWNNRQAGTIQDPDIGASGGQRVRVIDFVDEKISAPDAGYFIDDCTA